jgi:hypothetical protein
MRAMKTLLFVSMLWVITAALLVSCGGGTKAVSCQETGMTTEDCPTRCQQYTDIFIDDAWNKTGDCILQATCSADMLVTCATQVAGEISDDKVNSAKTQLCAKIAENCGVQESQCLSMVETPFSYLSFLIKLLKTSVVDCLVNCVSGSQYCITLITDPNSVLTTCAETCNIPLDASVVIN